MTAVFWAVALGVAVLWPARLAGPLDGAPLDSPLEAVALGVVLPALVWLLPAFLRSRAARALTVALLGWKLVLAGVAVRDGWCVRFTSPVPLFVEDTRIPHSWDVPGSHWRLTPAWNGQPLWSQATATMSRPAAVDLAIRPWGRWVTAGLIATLFLTAGVALARAAGRTLLAAAGAAAASCAAAISGRAAAMRLIPVMLLYAVWWPLRRRLQNIRGMSILVGIPFLALFAALGIPQAGLFTWYSSGDDWWMF